MNPRPHRRKRTQHGSRSYSRYGSSGKGLGDAAQHAYNAAKRATLTSGVDRAIFDRAAMTFQLDGTDMFRGLYNLPLSPQYAGGKGTYTPEAMQTYQAQIISAQRQAKYGSNQFGAITTGRGRGYPSWVTKMLGKANAPDKDNTSNILPVGLGILVLKVLL